MPAQVRHDDAHPGVDQPRDHVDVAVDVVREAVQQRHRAVGRAGVDEADVEHVRADLAHRTEPGQSAGDRQEYRGR